MPRLGTQGGDATDVHESVGMTEAAIPSCSEPSITRRSPHHQRGQDRPRTLHPARFRDHRHRETMTRGTGESDDRGRVWVFTSADGEVDTAPVALELGRAMELAGDPSIVLAPAVPRAEVTSDGPRHAARDNRDANNGTEARDKSGDASETSKRRGVDGIPDTLSIGTWAQNLDLATPKVAARLFDQLRTEYTQVIVAAPPVLKSSTASVMSEYADGVLLLVSVGTTRRQDLARAAEILHASGASLTGAVLTVGPTRAIVCGDSLGKQSETVDNVHTLDSDR